MKAVAPWVLVLALAMPSYAAETGSSPVPIHDALDRAATRLALTPSPFGQPVVKATESHHPVRLGIIIGGSVGLALGLWYAEARCRSEQNCLELATGTPSKTPNVLLTTATFGFVGAVIGCTVGAWVGGPDAHCR